MLVCKLTFCQEDRACIFWYFPYISLEIDPSPVLPPSMHTLTTPVYKRKEEKPGRQVLWEPERGIHVHVQPHAPGLVTLMPAEHRPHGHALVQSHSQ